ncbi:MAG: hypothetical protein ACE14L_06070 [Terriglobales bacterium]
MSARNFERSENPAVPRTMGAQTPADILEMRAAEQRRRMHNTVWELRETVRERTNPTKLARQYVWPATGIAAVAGLIMGYGMGGMFTR